MIMDKLIENNFISLVDKINKYYYYILINLL